MPRAISDIEKEIRSLDRPDQERLLRVLLEELDASMDPDAEQAWLDEIEHRSADFDAGLIATAPAGEVFERARAHLKR